MTEKPSMLEEFATGLDVSQSHPQLVTMASAKWQAALLCALSESASPKTGVSQLCKQYQDLAEGLVLRLELDAKDPRILNAARQALIEPASIELRESGTLTGDWLPAYAEVIEHMPAMFQVMSSPTQASTSLGMTLTNHYAQLFAAANEFAFLRQPNQIVQWAHEQIHPIAQQSAANIAGPGDDASAYQNQLNVHRQLFISAYKAEVSVWKPVIEEHPNSVHLYQNGLPLSGIETRFKEQSEQLQQLMGVSQSQSMKVVR